MTRRKLVPITPDRIDAEALKVVRRLTDCGHEAYLVGGCVRDLLLGLSPKDFDVATSATPEEIRRVFRNCRLIGRRFRLAHVFFGKKIIETATFRAAPAVEEGNATVPSAVPSAAPTMPTGTEHMIWRDNVFGTNEDDARRRDFTVNGLFYDLQSMQVLDLVDGLDDLRRGLIRTIGDPDLRFQEDPVRIIRGIKFAARLKLDIEPKTRRAMVRHRGLIVNCSLSRLQEEINKVLLSGASRPALLLMGETGVLPILFPELYPLFAPPTDKDATTPLPALRAGSRPRRSPTEVATHPLVTATPPTPDEAATAYALLSEMGYPTPEDHHALGARLLAYLEALDHEVAEASSPLPPALAYATLFAPFTESVLATSQRTGQVIERVEVLLATVARRLQLARRQREQAKQILVGQRRLLQPRKRLALAEREFFPDTLRLLRLRHRATGAFAEALARWERPGEETPRDNGQPQRRRRRRRRPSSRPRPAHPDAA